MMSCGTTVERFVSPCEFLVDDISRKKAQNLKNGLEHCAGIDPRILGVNFKRYKKRLNNGFADLDEGPTAVEANEGPKYKIIAILDKYTPPPKNGQRRNARFLTIMKSSWTLFTNLNKELQVRADTLQNFTQEVLFNKIMTTRERLHERGIELLKFEQWSKKEWDVAYFLDRGMDRKGRHWVLVTWEPAWLTSQSIENFQQHSWAFSQSSASKRAQSDSKSERGSLHSRSSKRAKTNSIESIAKQEEGANQNLIHHAEHMELFNLDKIDFNAINLADYEFPNHFAHNDANVGLFDSILDEEEKDDPDLTHQLNASAEALLRDVKAVNEQDDQSRREQRRKEARLGQAENFTDSNQSPSSSASLDIEDITGLLDGETH